MTKWVNSRTTRSKKIFYFVEAILTPTEAMLKPLTCRKSGDQKLHDYTSLKDLAKTANYYVLQWLKRRNIKDKVCALMTDFVNPAIINKLISMD